MLHFTGGVQLQKWSDGTAFPFKQQVSDNGITLPMQHWLVAELFLVNLFKKKNNCKIRRKIHYHSDSNWVSFWIKSLLTYRILRSKNTYNALKERIHFIKFFQKDIKTLHETRNMISNLEFLKLIHLSLYSEKFWNERFQSLSFME